LPVFSALADLSALRDQLDGIEGDDEDALLPLEQDTESGRLPYRLTFFFARWLATETAGLQLWHLPLESRTPAEVQAVVR
jgi:hypothetical protein